MADTPAETRQANEKIPKGGKLQKYRWYIIGGLALLAVLVFYFVNKSKQNAQASGAAGTSSLAAMGIDPATGVPYAQEYANAYGGGLGMSPYGGGGGGFGGFGGFGGTGPAGPRGGTGPAGPKGPQGGFKPFWQQVGKGQHGRIWVTSHGVGHWEKVGKRWTWIKAGSSGISKSGSRTQGMTEAIQARQNWNTRIVPQENQHTYAR